jgi:GNAT superfamily N-acetyltransferase
MATASKLRRLFVRIRREGLVRTMVFAADICKLRTFGIYLLENPVWVQADSGLRIERGAEALRELRSRTSTNLPRDFYLDECGRATLCFSALTDGRLSGVIWVMTPFEQSAFIKLAADECELSALYVLPEYRGRGIAAALISYAAQSQGDRRVYAVIREENTASRLAFAKCGFRRVATLRRRSLFSPRYLGLARRLSECATL